MKKLILSAFSLSICVILKAQDVHFSHAEYSPLTLNPGLAGALSPVQGIVNFRSQWRSVASPYKTIAASIDARFNEKKRDRKGIIAGGLNFYNDQAGDLKVVSNNVNLNLAYHLIINRNSTLGVGISTGYGQRTLNPNAGRWGSQYINGSYDPSAIPNLDFISNASFSFLDAGTGMVYSFTKNGGYMTQNNQRSVVAGVAAYHLNKPNYSFTGNTEEKLSIRYSAFVNAVIGIQNTRGSILPGIYYQRQGVQQEFLFGANYKYLLSEGSAFTGFTRPMALYLGLFSRFRDALVAKAMFEYDCYAMGFAYDLNVSELRTVSGARGGFELFLRYNLVDGGGFRTNK